MLENKLLSLFAPLELSRTFHVKLAACLIVIYLVVLVMPSATAYQSDYKISRDFVYVPKGRARINPETVQLVRMVDLKPVGGSFNAIVNRFTLFDGKCITVAEPDNFVEFVLHPGRRSHEAAQAFCVKTGGSLPEIRSRVSETALFSLMRKHGYDRVHAGLTMDPDHAHTVFISTRANAENVYYHRVCLQNNNRDWEYHRQEHFSTFDWTYYQPVGTAEFYPCIHRGGDKVPFKLPTICAYRDPNTNNTVLQRVHICRQAKSLLEPILVNTYRQLAAILPDSSDLQTLDFFLETDFQSSYSGGISSTALSPHRRDKRFAFTAGALTGITSAAAILEALRMLTVPERQSALSMAQHNAHWYCPYADVP